MPRSESVVSRFASLGWFAVSLAVAGLAACGSASPACPAAPAVKPGNAFLWTAQREGGPVLYLFGTIHDAAIEMVPAVALTAFDHSARIATELGDAQPDRDELRDLERIAHGPGLDAMLGDDWWDLRDALRGTIHEDDLKRTRPWFALILLDGKNKGTPVVAMDTTLVERATERKKPIDAMESAADQMKALDSVVTVEDLRAQLHSQRALQCAYSDLVAAYAAGDEARITPYIVVDRTAEPLIYARNRAWIAKITSFHDTTFIAVGLGHMLGEQGLPALLQKAGYTIARVEK
ncbi:MAG TPA: TraB/GumN family protein [Kofleriaceae bacterium]